MEKWMGKWMGKEMGRHASYTGVILLLARTRIEL